MELAVSETRLGLRRIFTGIVRDITEIKQAFAERTRLITELREADQRKDHFLAMLAHELRNPLAPISNAVQIMRVEGPSGPNLTWSIEVISEQIKHMTRIVDDLLDVSRITRGKIVLQKEPTELERVIELAVQACRSVLGDFNHELRVSLPPEPVVLDVDPARMAQVLNNLLNNAAKYTPEGGLIQLSARLGGARRRHQARRQRHRDRAGAAPQNVRPVHAGRPDPVAFQGRPGHRADRRALAGGNARRHREHP